MEISTRDVIAFEGPERNPLQQKLTSMFKIAKKNSTPPPLALAEGEAKSTIKTLLLQQQEQSEVSGFCRLPPSLLLVKPEREEEEEEEFEEGEDCQYGVSGAESPKSRLLCRASAMFIPQAFCRSLGPTNKLELPSLDERLVQNLSLLAPPSLQRVKRELRSLSSCVTNDTDSVESLATAHANLMGSKSFHSASASLCAPDGAPEAFQPLPAVASEALEPLPAASEAFQPLQEQVTSSPPLMTAWEILQASVEHSSHVKEAKTEAVEPTKNLITALYMLGGKGGGGEGFVPSSSDAEAHLQSQDLKTSMQQTSEAAAAAATTTTTIKPKRLMTALHMIPDKLDPMEVDIRCEESSLEPTVPPPLLHVKTEPRATIPEPEPLSFPKETPSKNVFLQSPLEGEKRSYPQEFKPRKTNPGRRIQGGRLYDSVFGKTCHWCRQKTVEPHVKCRECTIHYCGPCLINRNGENIRAELCEGVRWLCPKCRNGCGPGCENCCNCGPCRKALGKLPTGIIIGVARRAGFNNAHDYLVYLETGESPAEIARRKVDEDWTNGGRFEYKDASVTSESGDGTLSSSEGSDEFTLNEETSSQVHQGTLDMKYVRKFVQSQKRKSVSMRASLPAKRSHVEPSPASRRRTVDSVLSRLKVCGQSVSKGKEDSAKSCSRRVVQKVSTLEKCFDADSSIRNRGSEMKTSACKREYLEINDVGNFSGSELEASSVAKRRKLGGDHLFPFSEAKCKIEPDMTDEDIRGGDRGTRSFSESEGISKMRGARASSQPMFEQLRGIECPSDPRGTDYRMKLKYTLARPFDAKELEALDYSVRCRKPVQKLRHMRNRSVDIVTEDEGLSYLDHHQDFAAKLKDVPSPPEKLALLRGFFFWLQHSCMEGAFRPWPSAGAQSRHQFLDCMESEGPDCQVTAVVLQLNEGNEAEGDLMHTPTNTVDRPFDMTSFPRGSSASRQFLIPFRSKKNLAQPVKPKMRAHSKESPFQVVLALPAPALIPDLMSNGF